MPVQCGSQGKPGLPRLRGIKEGPFLWALGPVPVPAGASERGFVPALVLGLDTQRGFIESRSRVCALVAEF